jgi:uncharacterized protein YecE (DUF72 family)
VRIGTAAWGIPQRSKHSFPKTGSQLQRYARRFTAVEINSSFHKHHSETIYARWAQSVGKDFRFACKLPRALTHEGALHAAAGGVLNRFLAEIAGLGNKLSVLIAQLPPGLAFDRRSAGRFFAHLRRRIPKRVALVCEPRHPSWGTPEVDDFLKQRGIGRVAADPARWVAAAHPGGHADLRYFRLHGSPRIYFSDYDAKRLNAFRTELESAARTSKSVWCIFDNTAHGHATDNALWMQRALRASSASDGTFNVRRERAGRSSGHPAVSASPRP